MVLTDTLRHSRWRTGTDGLDLAGCLESQRRLRHKGGQYPVLGLAWVVGHGIVDVEVGQVVEQLEEPAAGVWAAMSEFGSVVRTDP